MGDIDGEIEAVTEFDWMARGACRGAGTELWFPTRGETTDEARAVCADCPVREECLEYALARRIDHGTWGGTSERERRRIIRRRRRGAA